MSLEIVPLAIPEVKLIVPPRFGDDRGWFSVTYNAQDYAEAGIDAAFFQDNQSRSEDVHTLRGLHFQAPPYAQAKLVRVVAGRVIDVAVDVRKGSSSFGQWVKQELTAERGEQMFVPRGFLHGFLTLEPGTEVAYKVDAAYDRGSDGSVRWDDPDLAIDWGVPGLNPVLSDKDRDATQWADFDSPF
ncbi:MAG: dTDP-4-dehydrorhamnose 3,5-epimerase [Pseudomonadota bacterium]